MTKEDRRRMMDYIERIKKATSDAELWLMYKGYTREDGDEDQWRYTKTVTSFAEMQKGKKYE